MKINELKQELKNNIIRPYYFIFGSEEHIIGKALDEISKIDGIMFPELNVQHIKNDCSADEIKRNLCTMPFACTRRLVICDIDCLDADSKKKIADFLPDCPDTAVFVLVKHGKGEKSKVLEKELMKSGNFVECSLPSESDTVDYLTSLAAKKLIKFSRKAATFFIEYVGDDMLVLLSELDKLLLVAQGEITTEDIKKYCIRADSYNIFFLHELMLDKNLSEARQLVCDILKDDDKPIGLISLLASNFEIMLMTRSCLDAGYSPDKAVRTVVDNTGVKDFRARKALSQCRKISLQDIRQAIVTLSDADFRAKHGGFVFLSDLFPLLLKVYAV